MKLNRIVVALLILIILALSIVVFAQVKRPYKNGTVWVITFVRMKPGMERAYMDFVEIDWKREQEALKKRRADTFLKGFIDGSSRPN